jgi:hypothetical protein
MGWKSMKGQHPDNQDAAPEVSNEKENDRKVILFLL